LFTVRYQNAVFGILLVGLVLRDAYRKSLSGAIREAVAGLSACLIPITLEGLHYVATHGLSGGLVGWQTDGTLVVKSVLGSDRAVALGSPYFFNILFSCQHGVFYWTPTLALGFAGLVWAAHKESWAWVFLVTFLGHIYLLGGIGLVEEHSFGARYLSECAPILAVGLTVLIQASVGLIRLFWWRAVLGILVTWNSMLMMAYGLGSISRSACVTFAPMMRQTVLLAIIVGCLYLATRNVAWERFWTVVLTAQ
jgi:hypothetical protein